MLKEIRLDTYCSKRIEFEKIGELAKVWKKTQQDHRYLEAVLLHEYLEEKIELDKESRKVAKDCVKLVGDFYKQASYENNDIIEAFKKKEIKLKEKKVKYRRD